MRRLRRILSSISLWPNEKKVRKEKGMVEEDSSPVELLREEDLKVLLEITGTKGSIEEIKDGMEKGYVSFSPRRGARNKKNSPEDYVTSLKQEISNLHARLGEKSAEIGNLVRDNKLLTSKVTQLNNNVDKLVKSIEDLKVLLHTKQSQISSLKENLKTADKAQRELKKQLRTSEDMIAELENELVSIKKQISVTNEFLESSFSEGGLVFNFFVTCLDIAEQNQSPNDLNQSLPEMAEEILNKLRSSVLM